MKKTGLIAGIFVALLCFTGCQKEKLEEYVKCNIDGTPYKFTDVADWQYQDSTGNNYFLTWCYTNSGDIDHDFMGINYPVMNPGTYTLQPGPTGNPTANGYCVVFYNTAGERCVMTSGTITVEEYETQTSLIDPFKRFYGHFSFTLQNTVTSATVNVTDGEFNFSEF